MTQRQLAEAIGVSQPDIAALENGTQPAAGALFRRALLALDARPSVALSTHHDEVVAVAARHGATNLRVFGSVARGEDTVDSDVDLLATFRPGTSLYDLVDLTDELEALLGTGVDVVSERGLQQRHADILRDAVAL